MTIKFRCVCGTPIKAPDEFAGKAVRCPECRESVAVPRGSAARRTASDGGTASGDERRNVPPRRRKLRRKKRRKSTQDSTFRAAESTKGGEFAETAVIRRPAQKTVRKKVGWVDSFLYPVRGTNFFTYLGWTFGFSCFSFALALPFYATIITIACYLIVCLIAIGYFYHFLSEIVRFTAAGEDHLPETSTGDEVFLDAFNWWACVVICTSPFWGFHWFNWWTAELPALVDHSDADPVYLLPPEIGQFLLILCLLYTPMALLATTLFNTFLAGNPVYVIGAIFKCPLQYFTTCFVTVSVLFAYMMIYLVSVNFLMTSEDALVNMIAEGTVYVIAGNMLLYFSIVVMHQLGTIYYRNRKKIGWFRER